MYKKVLGVLSLACVLMLAACAPQKPEEIPEEIIEEETTVRRNCRRVNNGKYLDRTSGYGRNP